MDFNLRDTRLNVDALWPIVSSSTSTAPHRIRGIHAHSLLTIPMHAWEVVFFLVDSRATQEGGVLSLRFKVIAEI